MSGERNEYTTTLVFIDGERRTGLAWDCLMPITKSGVSFSAGDDEKWERTAARPGQYFLDESDEGNGRVHIEPGRVSVTYRLIRKSD